jgi:hypothetical protein
MVYKESIQCPSPWTLEHWMNAINSSSGKTYDKVSSVQAWSESLHTLAFSEDNNKRTLTSLIRGLEAISQR